MILGANQLGRVAGSAATQQRNAVQGLPVRTPVVQRNVTCNVATGPRPTAGGAPKPVQINLRDEGFDGMFQGLGVVPRGHEPRTSGVSLAFYTISPCALAPQQLELEHSFCWCHCKLLLQQHNTHQGSSSSHTSSHVICQAYVLQQQQQQLSQPAWDL